MKQTLLLYLLMLLPFAGFSQVEFPSPGCNTGIFCNTSTTWNGTEWSNGEPAEDKDVIFAADFTVGSTLSACSVFVQNGALVNFTGSANAVVMHSVNVQEGSALIFDSGCNLIQAESVQNSGNVTFKRNSSKIRKDDFTLWSSPVSGPQTLLEFSPETLINRFYTYNTVDNIYNTISDPSATTFTGAKGYLIRTPESHPEEPAFWEGEFTGVPNTGNVTIAMAYVNENKAYNAVGNPYPSPISITKFLEANTSVIEGTIWLWRKTNDAGKSSYATVTKLGYQSNTSAADVIENDVIADPFSVDEEGIINTGQGFIVKAKNTNNLVFDNAMRMEVSSSLFFRTNQYITTSEPTTVEASRIWLNVANTSEGFAQTLIGYTEEGTLEYDNGLDGESILDGGVVLYSIADNKKLAIQARPAFTDADEVQLGFKTQSAGTFEFSLGGFDGLFEEGQNIYIEDNVTGSIHNLKDGNYSFTSEAGIFEDRFKVIFSETLGTDNPAINEAGLALYSGNRQLNIKSGEIIESVVIYDLHGRIVFNEKNINRSEFTSGPLTTTNQMVVVNITLANNRVISKKVIIN